MGAQFDVAIMHVITTCAQTGQCRILHITHVQISTPLTCTRMTHDYSYPPTLEDIRQSNTCGDTTLFYRPHQLFGNFILDLGKIHQSSDGRNSKAILEKGRKYTISTGFTSSAPKPTQEVQEGADLMTQIFGSNIATVNSTWPKKEKQVSNRTCHT